jgi:hypothetical protein
MFRRSLILGGLVVAALALVTLRPTTHAQERRDYPGGFDGQFISIIKKSNPNSSTDLENAQMREVRGRWFVVGVGADVPDNWQKGRQVWVAMDDVSEVTTFATLEELRKAGVPQEERRDRPR